MVATLLVSIGDKVLIKKLISSDAVAYYSFAFDINSKANLLISGINMAMYALILKNHAQGKSHKLHIQISLVAVLVLAIFYYVPLMIFSFDIIKLLVSTDFAYNAARLTSIMAFASLFFLIAGVFGSALSAMGGARYLFYSHVWAVGIYFLSLIFLYKYFGLYGFMYSYLILCIILSLCLIISYFLLSRRMLLTKIAKKE